MGFLKNIFLYLFCPWKRKLRAVSKNSLRDPQTVYEYSLHVQSLLRYYKLNHKRFLSSRQDILEDFRTILELTDTSKFTTYSNLTLVDEFPELAYLLFRRSQRKSPSYLMEQSIAFYQLTISNFNYLDLMIDKMDSDDIEIPYSILHSAVYRHRSFLPYFMEFILVEPITDEDKMVKEISDISKRNSF